MTARGRLPDLDPRRDLGKLPDSAPITMVPVRLETRFADAGSAQAPRPQLWVRIYPDDISIDTFEPDLSDAEVTAAKSYWRQAFAAGGERGAEQAAWAGMVAAFGSGRSGYVLDTFVPTNLADLTTKATPLFPPDPPPKPFSWTQAPHVADFPERFVVLGYQGGEQVLEAIGGPVTTPLYVGPDPSADPADSIHPDGDALVVPDQLTWLVDFPAAQAAGLGLAIDLSAEQARTGFDRLLVLGVQLGAGADGGQAALEELLAHHRTGRAGLALVPLGTPTHNTTGAGAGYVSLEDADDSFADRANAPLFTPTSDPAAQRDGQVLADALGVGYDTVTGVHGAGGSDQLQGRAMQRALWPATLGYWMDKMLTPLFSDAVVATTREFFTGHVVGRGAVPSLRIGHQPYGILPTTAFSRIGWLSGQAGDGTQVATAGWVGSVPQREFLASLLTGLRDIDADWTAMSSGAAHVGASGDAHQILLDVVGLQPASVEYYWRYSESLTELYNVINVFGLGPQFWAALQALGLAGAAEALLTRLADGHAPATWPDILNHAFLTDSGLIGQLIDDRPLSETATVRPYTDDGRNYLQWLADAARASLDAVTAEAGFTGGVSPQALLYLFLRHAVLLGYYDAGYALHVTAGFLTPPELQAMKPEPPFIHVDPAAPVSESRFAALYKSEPRITGDQQLLVGDFVTRRLAPAAVRPETADLADQLAALDVLAGMPTAALERAFADHVDTCSYRFDAWQLALADVQLAAMRAAAGAGQNLQGRTSTGGGTYLGAYAWLEDLRPSGVSHPPAQVPEDVAADFTGDSPLLSDPANAGYVHAPSLTHARTAAVLRSGYFANASATDPGPMSVDLSSDRVRAALAILEGIRNGQSLGALLGYQFERGLHDKHGLAEVDKFIYPLRGAFPLVAGALTTTVTDPGTPIEAIEARNVMDGRKLADAIRSGGVASYPFGAPGLPAATADEAAAIDAEAAGILDTYDALADLALAESVHQAAQGNFDRVAATVDAYSAATFPPDPEVVQTPTVGTGLTHRVAVHLRPGLPPPAGATPRATAEPALDAWLASLLPAPSGVGATVIWTDPVGGTARSHDVTLADLGLRPIDLLQLVKPDDVQAMTELDDRILGVVLAAGSPRADADLRIRYQSAPTGKLSIFEVSALIRQLRRAIERARPLRSSDASPSNQVVNGQDDDVSADRTRVAGPKAELDALGTDVATFLTPLVALLADPVTNRATIIGEVDPLAAGAADLLERAARFGLPQAGWGFTHEWRRATMTGLLAAVSILVARWDGRLADYGTRLAAYDALPAATSDPDRFAALQAIEALVTTTLVPLPPAPATLRAGLDTLHASFLARRNAFAALPGTAFAGVADAIAAVQALLPIGEWDADPWDVTAFGDRAIAFAQDVQTALSSQAATITARSAAAAAQLDAHDGATTPSGQVGALQAGAKALFGDAFVLIPEFGVPAAQGDAWASSLAEATPGGALLSYLTGTAGIARPVEEWLAGLARVRPAMRGIELTGTLAEGFGHPAAGFPLVPAQLPYVPGEPWLAMPFPDAARPTSERLLYTAAYATPFDRTARQCGLLLDEWTEILPATTRETGLTFDYDRPDNEPPQAVLIVTPATGDGVWHWEDVVGALNETLDLARKRALEPAQLDNTPYASLLPATIMAVTLHGISISTAMAVASNVLTTKEVAERA